MSPSEKVLLLFLLFLPLVCNHLVGDKTRLKTLQKLCENAYTCFHDTVSVCGKSDDNVRKFLDLCDLFEFACENRERYRHVKDEECDDQA